MSRPKPLSGFPEFLPSGRIAELAVLDIVRSTFELHGFAPIETRAVEPLDQLSSKGEIDKEIYVVRRLHAVSGDADELGLHFDLTVPFASLQNELLREPLKEHRFVNAEPTSSIGVHVNLAMSIGYSWAWFIPR